MEPVLALEDEPRDIDQHEWLSASPPLSSSSSSSSSYSLKLVPWLRWDEWLFVYHSLFSDSVDTVASALRKISAWRSRGCVPVTVEVTASIVEIQQKDPYFRKDQSNDALGSRANQFSDGELSEEMLAMLYCMAIMRLVNGVVEKTRKKTEVSIAVAAAKIGIPRMLIDVRHEGSHRELPALQVVRSASVKALDWLKVYYWEPQKKAIPFQGDGIANIRKGIKNKLHELAFCLKAKQHLHSGSSSEKGKRLRHHEMLCGRNKFFSLVAGKLHSSKSAGSKKQLSKILKNLVGLYASYSSDVVLVLLDLLLKALKSSDLLEPPVDAQVFPNIDTLLNEWKLVITKLSNKEPELLLTLLTAVLDMIETHDAMKYEMDYRPEGRHIEHLSSLFTWLVRNFKELKSRHHKDSASEIKVSSSETTMSKALVMELLRRCLMLASSGNNQVMDSAFHLAQLIGNDHLIGKLSKFSVLVSSNSNVIGDDSSNMNFKNLLIQQDESICQAAKKLELIKLHQMKGKIVKKADEVLNSNRWVVARSWNPCPIGMLPRAVGSSGCLPVLDYNDDQNKVVEIPQTKGNWELNHCNRKREASSDIQLLDDSSIKKKRVTVEDSISNHEDALLMDGVNGRLMIGGVWKEVGQEELLAIKSSVRILI
ncbi:pre-rRNA-processing protein las1 isoform X5 [Ziziphus jujuba]|uniref:Pre-rRNA-processing protein las1 isoform X5 n=1 Tax=Ziziphus jujuba TaxID=326968 RepID=A0ABM3ZU41_ZIZJJ|nr:pre-rRNA-processing protein las1 isoform X5 [Ziziphus jujuba]